MFPYLKILRGHEFESLRESETFSRFIQFSFDLVRGAIPDREDRYFASMMKAFEQLGEDMMKYPYKDILGDAHMSLGSLADQQRSGEFYTPDCICELMAKLNFSQYIEEAKEDPFRTIKVHEPCCGSGRMLLAIANNFQNHRMQLRCYATDLNRQAAMMCFINTTLWGIPCIVEHSNTLTLETWGTWVNLPMITARQHMKEMCEMRDKMKSVMGILRPEKKQKKKRRRIDLGELRNELSEERNREQTTE